MQVVPECAVADDDEAGVRVGFEDPGHRPEQKLDALLLVQTPDEAHHFGVCGNAERLPVRRGFRRRRRELIERHAIVDDADPLGIDSALDDAELLDRAGDCDRLHGERPEHCFRHLLV